MINSIIEAINVALDGEFGEDYEIYMEENQQGFKEPCFLILCQKATSDPFPGRRYFRSNQFCVQYFPAASGKQRECNGMAERLRQCLEYIVVYGDDRPLRGTKMRYEVVGGILNFFVNYDCFVRVEQPQPFMGGVELSTGVKGGG